MTRIYNFSAGPATLPTDVLKKAQSELLDYKGSGMSVMELSHRSSLFEEIIQAAEVYLRSLLSIPDTYEVLFLQGGASLQFSMVPWNLAQNCTASYINTGSWSQKAISEAQKMTNVRVEVLGDSQDQHFTTIPTQLKKAAADSAYVHLTTNNTIEGTTFFHLPETGNVPLVGDLSSNILSVDYPVERFGLLYAGAQKNLGIAGLTVVIVRKELLAGNRPMIPSAMLDYQTFASQHSLYNTPPTFSIYMTKLLLEWAQANGGLPELVKASHSKAARLYDYLDHSRLFSSPVDPTFRSTTTIPFVTGKPELDQAFIAGAEKVGLVQLKGHRSVGGMRASFYNAFPEEGVTALLDYLYQFEKEVGGTIK